MWPRSCENGTAENVALMFDARFQVGQVVGGGGGGRRRASGTTSRAWTCPLPAHRRCPPLVR